MTALSPRDKSTFRRKLLKSKRIIQTPKRRVFFTQQLAGVFVFLNAKRLFKPGFFQSKKQVIITGLIILFVVVGVGSIGVYEYIVQNNPAIVYARKVQSLTYQVSKYVNVPTDEQPVIATVTDVKKLPQEQFFSYAQDGDKIIMYKKHKKAILFRPSTSQVITEATLDYRNTMPKRTVHVAKTAVAGASTSAKSNISITINPNLPTSTPEPYHPQGKILVMPQQ